MSHDSTRTSVNMRLGK